MVHEHRHRAAITSTRSSSASARSAWQNLEKIHQVVGDRVAAVFVTGTDFGTQTGPFISPRAYRAAVQAVPQAGQRLDPPAHHLEDLHPLLRLGGAL